jgi:hypothetical protein
MSQFIWQSALVLPFQCSDTAKNYSLVTEKNFDKQ